MLSRSIYICFGFCLVKVNTVQVICSVEAFIFCNLFSMLEYLQNHIHPATVRDHHQLFLDVL